jgi:hypothetical protein
MASFVPRSLDVIHTRALLHYRLGLPVELVLDILDKAHYWVESVSECTRHELLRDPEYFDDFSAALPMLGICFDRRVNRLVLPPLFMGNNAYVPSRETTKLREIEFLIVSHDQGWITDDYPKEILFTYKTHSWFEVSILRSTREFELRERNHLEDEVFNGLYVSDIPVQPTIHDVVEDWLDGYDFKLVPRPSSETEPQRMHSEDMHEMLYSEEGTPLGVEGEHTWYLQGNQVVRGGSIFEGDIAPRYRVVWGCKDNPVWEGNEGAGRGEGFIDSLKDNDWIVVWARTKVSWFKVRIVYVY